MASKTLLIKDFSHLPFKVMPNTEDITDKCDGKLKVVDLYHGDCFDIEAYVSFEVAKLLEEKGFYEVCGSYFIDNGDDVRFCGAPLKVTDMNAGQCLRPTQQSVCRWFREVHNIDIDINSECGMLGIIRYVPAIHTYKRKEKLHDTDEKVRWSQKTIYLRYEDDNRNVIQAVADFATFEEACDAAIEFCLKNLIK